MIQRILFATDLGAFHGQMLHYVLDLAKACQARVVLVHVVEPFGVLANAMIKAYMPDASRKELGHWGVQRILRQIKSNLVDSLADEYICENESDLQCIEDVKVLEGKPSAGILECAGNCEADLIVLGSHGSEAVGGNLLGSVTNKVLQLAKVPVFMVPLLNPIRINNGLSQTHLGY